MKKLPSLLAVVVALASIGQTLAASSVDVSVKGSITPAACTPLLSNGGVVDYGKMSVKDLHPYANTILPERSLQLSVTCEASTFIAVKSKDNRAGTSAEWDGAMPNFGLGLAAGDKKIGWYILKMSDTTADGIPRALIESMNAQTWFDASGNTVWQPGWLRTVNGAGNATPAPLPVTTLKTVVIISTTLITQRDLPIENEILIDGSATLEIVYL